jgi:hypothetical protein
VWDDWVVGFWWESCDGFGSSRFGWLLWDMSKMIASSATRESMVDISTKEGSLVYGCIVD